MRCVSARRPQTDPLALRARPPHPSSRLRPRPAHGGARRVSVSPRGMLPNRPQAQQPRPRLENACRSQRAGCGAALYLVNSLTIAAPLLQVSRGWVFCRRACLQSCRAGHLCHHASETLALPAHATLGTRASRPPRQPREKKPTSLSRVGEGCRGERRFAMHFYSPRPCAGEGSLPSSRSQRSAAAAYRRELPVKSRTWATLLGGGSLRNCSASACSVSTAK